MLNRSIEVLLMMKESITAQFPADPKAGEHVMALPALLLFFSF
jgi:hypothetical protein